MVTVPVEALAQSGGGPRVAKLAKKLGAKPISIDNNCAKPGPGATCQRRALDRVVAKLESAADDGAVVRILHLGDSHVASDYITKTIRDRLQDRFGDAGRGFTHPDQRLKYGGRRDKRAGTPWEKDRIVDTGRAGRPYGFSGISLESKKKGAKVRYKVLPTDTRVRIYYQRQPRGATLTANLGKTRLGRIDTAGDPLSMVETFDLPQGKRGKARLALITGGAKARIYGLSFETGAPGVLYDPIGPVGADAKVYLQLERASFKEHLAAHAPALVVLMVGGNDALKIRKGWTTPERVRKDHLDVIDVLRAAVPEADCLIWSPMDAGKRARGKIVTKGGLGAVRHMQAEVAKEKGCGFWDLHEAMGGEGSITRWSKAGVMNADLVHPRSRAADLLGHLFADAWMALHEGG